MHGLQENYLQIKYLLSIGVTFIVRNCALYLYIIHTALFLVKRAK